MAKSWWQQNPVDIAKHIPGLLKGAGHNVSQAAHGGAFNPGALLSQYLSPGTGGSGAAAAPPVPGGAPPMPNIKGVTPQKDVAALFEPGPGAPYAAEYNAYKKTVGAKADPIPYDDWVKSGRLGAPAKAPSDTEVMQGLQSQMTAPFVQQMHQYAKMLGGLDPKKFGVSGPYSSVFSQLLPAEAGAYDQLANSWQQYAQAAPMLNQLLNMIPSGTTGATAAAGGIDPAAIAAALGGTAPKV